MEYVNGLCGLGAATEVAIGASSARVALPANARAISIVAVNDGSGGIKGLPVRSPTFDQYRAAVGRVNRILPDGRAEIAVIVH